MGKTHWDAALTSTSDIYNKMCVEDLWDVVRSWSGLNEGEFWKRINKPAKPTPEPVAKVSMKFKSIRK